MKIVEHCTVQQILTNDKEVQGVETSKGHINCELFVNSAGHVSLMLFSVI